MRAYTYTVAAWITTFSSGGGSGNGTVRYSVAVNTSTTARSGTLTVAGQTFTVNQAGPPACSYSLSPPSASIGLPVAAALSPSRPPAVAGGLRASAWITITAGSSGNGNTPCAKSNCYPEGAE